MTIKFGFHENPILNPDLNNKFNCENDALKSNAKIFEKMFDYLRDSVDCYSIIMRSN